MSALRLLAAAALARTADAGAGVVLVLASIRQFGGPAQGSIVLAVLLVPHLLAGPLVGLVTDRARRPALVHAAFVAGFGAAIGGILSLLGHVPQPLVLLLALIAGCCGSMIFGGLSGRLDDVVAEPSRARYRGLDAATYNVADIFGPAAGAALAVSIGVPAAAAVIVAVCLSAAVLLLTVRPLPDTADPDTADPDTADPDSAGRGSTDPDSADSGSADRDFADSDSAARDSADANSADPDSADRNPAETSGGGWGAAVGDETRPADAASGALVTRLADGEVPTGPADAALETATRDGAPTTFGEDLRDGFRAIVVSPRLFAVTVATVVGTFGTGMMPSIAVLLGVAHGRPAGGGLLVGAIGLGALAGSLLMARRPVAQPPHRVVFGCLLVTGVLLAVVPLVPSWAGVVALFAVVGVFDGPLFTSVLLVRSSEAPARVRTQVFTLGSGVKLTAAAAGAAVFASVVGWPLWVLVVGLGATQVAAAAVGVLLLAARGHRTTP
ncbi:MFS transporter [Dactylosporangium sp. CS-047395]|uniref:MFS transporter n=1 Tax=Dactylosporangium sp. CS-047395 TaxID=3239936 RepID=UPI003D8BA567